MLKQENPATILIGAGCFSLFLLFFKFVKQSFCHINPLVDWVCGLANQLCRKHKCGKSNEINICHTMNNFGCSMAYCVPNLFPDYSVLVAMNNAEMMSFYNTLCCFPIYCADFSHTTFCFRISSALLIDTVFLVRENFQPLVVFDYHHKFFLLAYSAISNPSLSGCLNSAYIGNSLLLISNDAFFSSSPCVPLGSISFCQSFEST